MAYPRYLAPTAGSDTATGKCKLALQILFGWADLALRTTVKFGRVEGGSRIFVDTTTPQYSGYKLSIYVFRHPTVCIV